MLLFQSTPPVWTETSSGRFLASPAPISIHSARVGGDTPEYRSIYSTCLFQSTPPVWAETLSKNALQDRASDFNPLRPCGRRHARSFYYLIVTSKFQSTPPVWAETPTISTIFGINCDFNPLRPCGRRRLRPTMQLIHTQFQSTPPVWAETRIGLCGDGYASKFQSTPPVWAETQQKKPFFRLLSISITTYFTEKSKRTRCKFSHLGYLFQYSLLILVRTSLYVDV